MISESTDQAVSIGENHGASGVLHKLHEWLSRRSPWAILGVGGVVILLIGCFDFVTGTQVNSSLFYVLPVLFVTRYARRSMGVSAALVATLVWLIAGNAAPGSYAHPIVPAWNALMRLGVLLVVVWLVSAMRALNETLERRVQDRTARLQAETRERRELEKRILDISEREQARIGQDLHDGLCQHLVSTAFSANSLHQQLAGRAPMEADKAAEISELLDESITQARLLARGLYPVRLEEEGLATALQELAENVQSRFNVRCALFSTGQGQAPDQSVAIHLYRLAQEAINNAIKHGRPRTVRLDLRQEGTTCELSVTDDGQGISRGERRSDGMGLRIMEYRARMIGGTFEVQPGPEGGTIVRCVAKTS